MNMWMVEGIETGSTLQLMTFLGVGMTVGAFAFGLAATSKSQQCLISRQYLLQASIFGIGDQQECLFGF